MNKSYRLWVYTLCYNEKLIIPFIIKYWQQYAERVIVYDNGSDDGSVEELSKYDWIEVRHFESGGFNDTANKDLKNQCWKEAKSNGVDFVQVSDFDEVIWSDLELDNELTAFKNSSATIWNGKCYEVSTRQFPKDSNIFVNDNEDAVCTYSRTMTKKILFKPDEIEEINYSPGAHSCNPVGNVNFYNNENIKMLHIKHLGLDYFLEKNHRSKDRLSEENKRRGYGVQYYYNDDKLIDIFNTTYDSGTPMQSKKKR